MWNRLPPASQLFTTAWLTLIYLLVSVLTLQLGFATEYALPLWPAAGVGVGMLLLYHRVALLPILLGALLTDIYLEASLNSLISSVPNALAATLQAYIGYRFTRTLLRRSSALVRDQDILRFLLLSGPLACLMAPGIGIIMRLWNGQLLPEDAFSEWLTWWSGDTLGVLLFAPLTLLLLGRRQAHEASRRIGAYRIALPLLGASLLLGGGHLLLSHLQIQEAEYSIQGRMEKVNQLHFQSIAADLQHLEASSQMILSQEELTAAEFERFSQWLLHNPALISLDWAPRITAVERPAFEQQTGQELVEPLGEAKQDVVYVSAHRRNEHYPVLFSVPPAMGQTVKGLDHSWDPGRRAAMARAFATGAVQLSRPATLIRTGLNAVLAFAPVIRPEVEGQPAALLGMVVGVFEIERLFSPLLQQAENAGLAVRVTDITEPEQPLVLIDQIPQQDSIFRTDRLDLGGRQWQLDFVLLAPLHVAGTSGIERFYFLFAILAALLAAYTTLSLAERDLATRLTVMRRTRDLRLELNRRREAEREFERFFTVSLDLLCIADMRGYFRRINPAFIHTLGWSETELLSQPFIELVHPDNRQATLDELKGLEDGRMALHFENRYRCKDGSYRWIEWRALPQPNGLIFASAHDTTERHQATQQLEQLNTQLNAQLKDIQHKSRAIEAKEIELHTLLNNLLECVITIDPRGCIASANPAVEKVFGYHPDELIGQNVSMLMPDPDRSRHDGYLARYMETREPHFIGTSREVIGRHKDGHRIPLELAVTEYKVNGQTMFAGTLHDISEQKAMIAELTLARDEAERANQAKSTFLATMSHEIRTPMNGVVGLIEVLEKSPLNEQQSRMLATVRESAATLLTLIDDILDFSKIEAGRLELETQPFDLVELIETLCSSLVPVAHQRDVDLSLFIAPELPAWVLSDPVRLRQLLYNLIGNGIKFCSGRDGIKGRVSVRVDFTDGDPLQLKVRVADNGIGISAAQQQQLFMPFTQAETSTTRRYGGTGLGLAICRHLVDLMGGGIRLISEPEVGTVFILALPMRPAAAPEDQPTPPDLTGIRCLLYDSKDYNSDDLYRYLSHAGAEVRLLTEPLQAPWRPEDSQSPVVLISEPCEMPEMTLPEQIRRVHLQHGLRRRGRITAADTVSLDMDALSRREFINAVAVAAGRTSPGALHTAPIAEEYQSEALSIADARSQGRLILVAEDDRVNQLVILQQLSLLGYTAEVADDGNKALEMWQRGEYALLLTDLHMPQMDGYTLTREIREREAEGRHLPIIALTANALRGESNRALEQGMDAYLVKPVKLEQLKQTLEHWLAPGAATQNMTAADTPDRPETTAEAALDLNILRDLVGAEPALLREFLTIWQTSSTTLMAEVRAAWEVQDSGTLSSLAHRFKSSSRSIGALPLGDLCADLEMACRAHDHEEVAVLMQRFEQLYSQTDAAVTDALCHI